MKESAPAPMCMMLTWFVLVRLLMWLQFQPTREPSFFSMDVDGRVLRFDSTSKILTPGVLYLALPCCYCCGAVLCRSDCGGRCECKVSSSSLFFLITC